MAEQITHDVVKEAQSMGGPSPIDDPVTTTNHFAGDGDAPSNSKSVDIKPSSAFPTTSTNATSTDAAGIDGTQALEKVGQDAFNDSLADPHSQPKAVGSKGMNEQLVNGDSGEHSTLEDVSSQQASGYASGGSDTDISRPGSVDQAKDRTTGHLRSNSLKKPASFKSVSVTKKFLANSAVTTPPPRPGEKTPAPGQTSASALQSAKPRLVAKSGSGIGNVPRSALSSINGTGSGPDASKVWNKNQPIPPPPPKQFTDEELKQQYGIHLATRLQADESGKEAKWADIDDDEEDWAPETVQWMDGTKSTMAAAENQPPAVEEPKPSTGKDVVAEAVKPAVPPGTTSHRPVSISGTKTILKPGAHTQSGPTKSGLVLKGQPEKPTLVAKPSAPTPVKSPWATLPPVEKVSPVQINPPVQPPPPLRFTQRDSHGYDALHPPSVPAKEIAPDDFNRSWRDDRGNRELFNSHSGRYEPVNEMRRGSVRENNFRQQPSVLQRPSQDGPAEPSAAFQTSRTSVDGPGWGRRRTSSNVSGGSGRRMSIDRRGPDVPHMPLNIQRRGSQPINGSDIATPVTPRLAFAQKATLADAHHTVPEQPPSWAQKSSPSMGHVQPASPYGSVASSGHQEAPASASASASAPAPAPGAPAQMESAVEIQNRLMREKLERARLAKQKEREREEKEEAERKERLRKKLEAMGLASQPSKPKDKEPSPSRSATKTPPKGKAVPVAVAVAASAPAPVSVPVPVPMQSPPKPPVPTSEGEVAQYGMMKVHQPQPVKKAFHLEAAAAKSFSRSADAMPKPSPSPVKAQADVLPKLSPSLTDDSSQPPSNAIGENNNIHQAQALGEVESRVGPQTLKAANPPQPPWSNTLSQQPRAPWATLSSAPTSSVWGPPQTKDRALGNGTFDSSYTRGQPRPTSQQLPSPPQAVPGPALGLKPSLKASSSQSQPPPTPTLPSQAISPQPITMPPRNPHPNLGAWANFAEAIRQDDKDMRVKARQDYERMGGDAFRPEFRETYKDMQGKTHTTLREGAGGPASTNKDVPRPTGAAEPTTKEDTKSVSQQSPAPALLAQPTTQVARSSRFFPRPSETQQSETQQQSETTRQSSSAANISDSPPPPETESHPAFTGDSHHPVVRMPKPSPRVRLPPSGAAATAAAANATTGPPPPSEGPVSMPNRARLGLGARPLALDPEWQARFNSLLDKAPAAPTPQTKVQPSKPGSLAIAAASKAPLEVRGSTTVSLPNPIPKKVFADDGSSDIVSRATTEEILLEEREFGSLPVVKLSKVPHLAANEPPVGFPISRPNSRFSRQTDVATKSEMNMADSDQHSTSVDVVVRLGNLYVPITKTMQKKRDGRDGRKGSNTKSKRPYNTSDRASTSGANQRARKPSNYQGQNANTNPNSHGSPRPSSGGNGWSNNRPTPSQTNSNSNANSWTRRAAPVH